MNKVILCLLWLLAAPAMAWQIDEAEFKARLIVTQQRAQLGEEVAVNLELATPNWFTQAANIQLPSQQALLWLQRQVFADNFRQRIDGKMWTVQRWPLAIFPRQTGQLTLSPVVVSLAVANEHGKSIEKTVTLEGSSLLGIAIPDIELVASDYRVQVLVNGEIYREGNEMILAAGESLQLAYRSEAENSLAMFLPKLVPQFSHSGSVAIYENLPELVDESERGRRTARRTDNFTVLATQQVSIHAPAQQIIWWDKLSDQQQLLIVPALGPLGDMISGGKSWIPSSWVWFALLAIVMVLYWLGHVANRAITPLHQKRYQFQQACIHAVQQGDWSTFASNFYALYDSYQHYRGVPLRTAVEQQCDADSSQRLAIVLNAAYLGEDTFVDSRDPIRLHRIFKQLAAPFPSTDDQQHAPFIL